MTTIRFSALRFSSTLALFAALSVSLFAGAEEPAPRGRGASKRSALRELKAPAEACVPACRSGYLCVQGECVSKCNPGCGAGERCTDAGECEATGASSWASPSPAPAPKPARRGAKRPGREAKSAPPAIEAETAAPAPEEAKPLAESGEGGAPAEGAAKVEAVEGPFGGKVEAGASVGAAPLAGAPAGARSGVRRHDGFYMRLGIGVAGLLGDLDDHAVELGGLGVATELAFGGTVAPGLVIGGGSYPVIVPTTSYELHSGSTSLETDGGTTTLTLLGPFVDYYPNPRGGLHVQSSLGLGAAAIKFPSDTKASGTSLGAMLGVGYEWWVGEQWSMGVLGRVTTIGPSLKDDNDAKWDASFTTFGLLGSFTYH